MRIRPRHAAWLLVPAGAAAALLAAVRAPDPAPVRAQRELAQRMLARLDRQSSELAEEDAKFEAEIVRVEGRHREKAVEREALVKEVEKAFLVKFDDEARFLLTVNLKNELTSEIWAMEGDIETLERERDALAAEIEELGRERAAAPPERGEALDREIAAKRADLAAREKLLRGARADIERARRALTNR